MISGASMSGTSTSARPSTSSSPLHALRVAARVSATATTDAETCARILAPTASARSIRASRPEAAASAAPARARHKGRIAARFPTDVATLSAAEPALDSRRAEEAAFPTFAAAHRVRAVVDTSGTATSVHACALVAERDVRPRCIALPPAERRLGTPRPDYYVFFDGDVGIEAQHGYYHQELNN